MKKILICISLLLAVLLAFSSCACSEATEEDYAAEENDTVSSSVTTLYGGWSNNTSSNAALFEKAQKALNKAQQDATGITFTAKELIATQVVSGTNYKLLCDGTLADSQGTTKEYYVIVYEDLDGNCEIVDFMDAE